MRRKRSTKREILPDYQWENAEVAKFINHLMYDGKKSTARKVMYDSLEQVKKLASVENPLVVFDEAMQNVSPVVELKSRRVGGANYQVPIEVRGDRRLTLAVRWLITAARSKKGKPMSEKLAEEIIAASKNEGAAIKKKLDTHRMAEANKAFAHFAW
jgi:small subunit ribosomal protein S7